MHLYSRVVLDQGRNFSNCGQQFSEMGSAMEKKLGPFKCQVMAISRHQNPWPIYKVRFNPIQARVAHCAPSHQNHSISSKRVWSYCFVTFLSRYLPFRKAQFHQSALMYVAISTIQFSGFILKTRISIVFKVFPLERNFLWNTVLCLGHHNTLSSLIKVTVRTVTVE